MNILAKIIPILLLYAAAAFAGTANTATTEKIADSALAKQESEAASQASITDSLAKKHAVWIKLEGDVEPSMFDFCARAIDDALKEKPDYIVFEINTFGGRLDAAFDIVDTIMAVKGPETIALVKKKAISAGSLIALACKRLYMLEATTIGDCAPIVQGGDGTPQIVGEKIQSPLRAKFRNLAQRNGYPELLSSSFVTPELEILELKRTLDKGTKNQRDTVLIIEGEKYEVLDKAEKELWGAPKILVKEGELLTMTDKEAEELGFSKGTFKDRADFETALAIERRSEVETTLGEDIASAIAAISGILLILGFGALYIEFKTPGFGLFGIIGIILIGIVFLGQFAPQLDGYIPAILLVAGVALFLVEIFVMPGTFLFGVGGIACMILALALSFSPSEMPEYIPETVETTFDATPWLFGLLYMLCCAAIALVFPIAASKYLIPLLPEGWTPMLKTDLETAASPTESVQEVSVGDTGEAKTFLRPVGQATINGKLFDVQTHGEIIEAGTPIKVIAVQEGHIWVGADNV
ncbi:MAG: ATP-dependent Clp protease proteolytic subunit [Fibrobacter sp.]|uniref:NfeD family protein n=1 Tax=Fibrobacter sp. TaxID=35828 RepID=UPI001B1BAA76|nr:NfeD family protein [Fibrobacter sp.]MBO7062463.1 ATP-dependent Clp protease proteolytic subunit [Fibrobacter sp.]MBO7103904.1 ATP-dependent Clp protease proteolytic subunit [Fibrobacter sp.]